MSARNSLTEEMLRSHRDSLSNRSSHALRLMGDKKYEENRFEEALELYKSFFEICPCSTSERRLGIIYATMASKQSDLQKRYELLTLSLDFCEKANVRGYSLSLKRLINTIRELMKNMNPSFVLKYEPENIESDESDKSDYYDKPNVIKWLKSIE